MSSYMYLTILSKFEKKKYALFKKKKMDQYILFYNSFDHTVVAFVIHFVHGLQNI